MYIILYITYSVYYTICNLLSILYYILPTLYIILYITYSVYYTIYYLLCILYYI